MEIIKKEKCQHQWQFIGQIEAKEGIGFLFYCKHCLEMTVRGIEGGNKDEGSTQ